MFDYMSFLSEITGDATWRRVDDLSFENASRRISHFALEDGSLMLSIDGKPIYSGPFAIDHPELVH
jgi:hypothetical protein